MWSQYINLYVLQLLALGWVCICMYLSIYFQTMDRPKCSNLFIKFFLGPLLRENLDVRRIPISLEKELTIALSCGMIEKAFRPCPEKTLLFLYGYGFRPHESDENNQWKRNFSKTLSRVELFENADFPCTCGQTKTELFEKAEDKLSVPIHSAQYYKLIEGSGRALSFLVFYNWAYFKPNCLFSSKFTFVNSSSWLFQEAAELYQVTLATGVKRRKVGSPFSLSLFLPLFWHFNCFCDFEERHNNIYPHQRNSKMASIYHFAGS